MDTATARTRRTHAGCDERGFTLIELGAVIVLLVLMSALALSRFGTLDVWKERAELRKFISVWEMLAREAQQKGESYRLIVDLAESSYYVRREVVVDQRLAQSVDRLEGFRAKIGRNTREERLDRDLRTLEEEYREEDSREGESLELIYYRTVYRDPEDLSRLAIPLDFPSLAEPQYLPPSIRVRDAVIGSTKRTDGKVYIRFAANGSTDFAVLHLLVSGTVYTALMNPATGSVKLEEGDKEYEFTLPNR